MYETPIVKDLRDAAAISTKSAENPFEERKLTLYWRAAEIIETLQSALHQIADGASDFGSRNCAVNALDHVGALGPGRPVPKHGSGP